MKRRLTVLGLAVMLSTGWLVTSGEGSPRTVVAAAAPEVHVQATCKGFVNLTVTGTGFNPSSPVTVSVHSPVLSFVVSNPSLVTDATGSMSFGPDEIVAPFHNGVIRGTASVTDGSGATATGQWSTICRPLRGTA